MKGTGKQNNKKYSLEMRHILPTIYRFKTIPYFKIEGLVLKNAIMGQLMTKNGKNGPP
jgi:hypothetical protein